MLGSCDHYVPAIPAVGMLLFSTADVIVLPSVFVFLALSTISF
jgi:hypothetical protein